MSGHVSPKSTYIAIFATLMVLTGVTVAVAYIDLGMFNPMMALGIAVFKATLVVLFFMHVKYSSRLTKMVVAMSFFFLAIMFGLTLTDYMSRGWYTSPRGSTGAGTQVGISANPPVRTEPAPAAAEPAQEPAR